MTRWGLVFACLVLLAVLAAGCGGDEESGVLGLAVYRPLEPKATFSASPLPAEMGWTTGGVLPDPHAVVVIKSHEPDGWETVARVTADERGVFRASLPPGEYYALGKGLPQLFKTEFPVGTGEFTCIDVETKVD